MSEQPRFDDAQVAEILRQASLEAVKEDRLSPVQQPARSGLTLGELKQIASEVGISGAAVERAAESLARGDHLPATFRSMAGLPIGVDREITLPRTLSADEWDRVVFLLQETFAARGKQYAQGDVREWRNGNLRALLEPDGATHRLRLTTTRSDARLFQQVGLGVGGCGAAFLLFNALGPRDPAIWGSASMLLVLGGATLLRNVFVLPRWARIRAAQMQSLGARIAAVLARSP